MPTHEHFVVLHVARGGEWSFYECLTCDISREDLEFELITDDVASEGLDQ